MTTSFRTATLDDAESVATVYLRSRRELVAFAPLVHSVDLHDVSPGHLLGLAAITLGLGIAYWPLRDDRMADGSPGPEDR